MSSLKTFAIIVAALLDHGQTMMVLASTTALSEVGRCGVLPLCDESGDKEKVSKLSIVENLVEKVKCQKDSLNPKVLVNKFTFIPYTYFYALNNYTSKFHPNFVHRSGKKQHYV